MKINNKKTVERFVFIVGFIWLFYAGLWIYNIFALKIAPAAILIQAVILLMISCLLVFLYWIWKEAKQ
jgi:hypothetical protein